MSHVSKFLKITGEADAIAVISTFVEDGIESAAQILGGNVEAARRILHKAGFTDKILKYKRHLGTVKYFPEDKLYYGSVLGTCPSIAYEGATEELLEADFRRAVDEYLAFCEAESAPTETIQACAKIMVKAEESVRKRWQAETDYFLKESSDPDCRRESTRCILLYRRLQALYRIPMMSNEIAALLMDVVDAMWTFEKEAERQGMVLNPLDFREMEAAFPFRSGALALGKPEEEPKKKWSAMEALANEPPNGVMSNVEPEVSIIPSGGDARTVHGYQYGAELLKFTRDHLDALLGGEQLAVGINGDEYVLFVEAEQDGQGKPLWTQVKYWEGRIPPPECFAGPPAYSAPGGSAVKYKELFAYAKQTGRDVTKLSREVIDRLGYYMSLPYRIEIIPDHKESGFALCCPELPGCTTCADTIEQGLAMLEGAKRCWFAACLEDGIEIPEPDTARGVRT